MTKQYNLMDDYDLIHKKIIDDGLNPETIPRNVQTINYAGGLHPTVVHEQLENKEVLRDIEMQLRGLEIDFKTGMIIQRCEPLIKSDECIKRLLSIMRPHLDKNIKISDLTDEEIYKHMFDLAIELDLFLYIDGYHKYNIKEGDLPIIKRIILNPIFSNYKSSRGGRQLDALREIEKVSQTITEPQAKKSLFSRLGLKI